MEKLSESTRREIKDSGEKRSQTKSPEASNQPKKKPANNLVNTSGHRSQNQCQGDTQTSNTTQGTLLNTQTHSQTTIPVSNRYGVLQQQHDTITDTETSETTKPPPIKILQKINSFTHLTNSIRNVINSNNYRVKYTANATIVYLTNLDDYHKLVRDLKEKEVEFFTYTPKNEREVKAVIRAAPFISSEDIKNNLQDQGLDITGINQFKTKSGTPSAAFKINMSKDTNLRQVHNIRNIGPLSIDWERFNRKEQITQCRRCQRFGHGQKNCNLTPRCVKCPENHITSECRIKEIIPGGAKCVNCMGAHTANYHKCPVRLTYIESINKQIVEKNITNTRNTNTQPSLQKPNFPSLPTTTKPISNTTSTAIFNNPTYASITNKSIQQPNSPSNAPSDISKLMQLVNDINNIIPISKLLGMLQTLKDALAQCANDGEKLLTTLEIVNKFNN